MSSNGTPQLPDTDEVSGDEVLILIGAITGLLVGLFALRYVCVFCIDLCILRDTRLMCLQLKAFLRRYGLGDRGRNDEQNSDGRHGDVEMPTPSMIRTEANGMSSLLRGLTKEQRTAVLESVLPSKVASARDLSSWRREQLLQTSCMKSCAQLKKHPPDPKESKPTTQETSGIINQTLPIEGGTTCAICLNDIVIGDSTLAESSCSHVFHRVCILEWLDKNTACPYCRTQMITMKELSDAIHDVVPKRDQEVPE